MSMYPSYPQLEALQTRSGGCSSTTAGITDPLTDQQPVYYYTSASCTAATDILDYEEDVLCPSSFQFVQSSFSPNVDEFSLAIESDNFIQQQQQHDQYQQLYVYQSTLNFEVTTPSPEVYDIAVLQSIMSDTSYPPSLPNSSSSRTTSLPIDHHQRTLSSSSTCSSGSPIVSSPVSFSSSFLDEPTHHSPLRTTGSLFHCDYKDCTKTFTCLYNFKSHKRIHTDEKPFVCDMCPKAFARQHDCNRHAKLHLGLKPFPCSFCTKSFARQDALNRHLKRDKKKNAPQITKQEDILIAPPPCLLLKVKQRQKAILEKNKQLE